MKNKKILVVAAHPDDLDFSCAGTLALLSKDNEIIYLICTSGEKGTSAKIPEEQIKETRENEQKNAAKIVGSKEVIFLREKDGELINTLEFRLKIVREIRKFKPDIIFTHDPSNVKFDNFHLYHPDHRAVASAVFDSIYPAVANNLFFSCLLEEGYMPHKIQEVYFFGTQNPNKFIDIEKTIDVKIKALLCHKSQIKNPEEIKEIIKKRASDFGKLSNMKYAEAFRVLEVPS